MKTITLHCDQREFYGSSKREMQVLEEHCLLTKIFTGLPRIFCTTIIQDSWRQSEHNMVKQMG